MLAANSEVTALAEALRPALLRVSRRLRQEARKAGLSEQDALLLGQIRMNPGIGVSALADAERTSRPTMSAHVKRLAEAGLVSRSDDAEDGRRCGLAITSAGLDKLDQIRRERNDWLASRLRGLPPEERDALARAAAPLLRLVAP
ncbi:MULTISPECIES: MarR family winged helix-turn-helix transcriptional regulator [Phenylobacterium]|uniref:DNA-binding MarR family transcriptional regulator n=1 Tax=Phenylobacterium koreense TaxID=266125 RepID=A0ABV2EGR5_9CAUL